MKIDEVEFKENLIKFRNILWNYDQISKKSYENYSFEYINGELIIHFYKKISNLDKVDEISHYLFKPCWIWKFHTINEIIILLDENFDFQLNARINKLKLLNEYENR